MKEISPSEATILATLAGQPRLTAQQVRELRRRLKTGVAREVAAALSTKSSRRRSYSPTVQKSVRALESWVKTNKRSSK